MASHASTPLDSATEAAIGWLVQLHSGDMGAPERDRLAQWLDADPQHRTAWEQLQVPLQRLRVPQPAAGRLLSDTLARAESRTRKRRQVLRGALGLGGVAVGATWLADRHQPVAQWSADLRTGTGERREFLLPDGSRLTLDARSAVDLDFRPGHRRVRLRQGALLAEATPRADLGPAFTVHTVHGQVQALGTRFTVRLQDTSSLVGMLEHSVEITTASGQQRLLHEGHSARFNATDIEDADTLSPEGTAAWRHGMLQVHDQPLADVVQALRAYRPGVLRIAPRAAALQVYGTYALDDTDRALTVLAETLPITVHRALGGWLVTIE